MLWDLGRDLLLGVAFSGGAIYPDWGGVGVPSVLVRSDGRHEFFFRRSAGGMQLIWETVAGGSFARTSFPSWPLAGNPAVILRADGRHEVFYRTPDGSLQLRWESVPGDGFTKAATFAWGLTGDPVAVLTPDGRHEVFSGTAAGALAVRWENSPGDGFTGAATYPSSWGIVGTPAVARRADGRHEVFYRTTNDRVMPGGPLVVRWEVAPGDSYAGSANISVWGTVGDPAVILRPDGRHEVFFIGPPSPATPSFSGFPPSQPLLRFEITPGDGFRGSSYWQQGTSTRLK